MTQIVTAVLLFCMTLILIRALKGPSSYDRILAGNLFGTHTVLLIVVMAFLSGDMMYLDIALVYALINFTATIGLLKYFKYGSFDVPSPGSRP